MSGSPSSGRSTPDELDPITVEVINNRIDEAVREMQHVMFRTGYSTIIRDSKDGSGGICLPDGRVIGQAFRLPLHCGVFPPTIEAIRERFPPAEIRPGDTFIANDPYHSGANHSPDMVVAAPVFADGDLSAFCLTIAHKPDIGGLVPGTSSADAREIFHEGLLLPPVKYRREGTVNEDIVAIIENNTRTPETTLGDIRGQARCTEIGAEKLRELFGGYGVETVRSAADRLIESTRSQVAEAVAPWDGSAAVTGQLDTVPGADEPIDIALEVRTDAGDPVVTFDFTGSAPQTAGPSNMRPHVVRSACYYALVGVLDPSLPLNAGIAESCDLVLPERSVVNPERPAPCNNYSKGLCVAVHTCLRALAAFEPDGAVAETGGKMSIAIGRQPDAGDADSFVHYEIMGSGYGGHAAGDGASCMASSYESNAELADIEILETEFPDRVTEFSVRPDSAGGGEFRGGLGFVREYTSDDALSFTYRGANHRVGSQGVRGGGGSGRASATRYADGAASALDTIDTVDFNRGDRIRLERPGGAGFGDPYERDPQRVLADVRNGFVTTERARDAYGVAVVTDDAGTLRIDEAATRSLRS
jgi:N-methylhydantoinase B